MQYLCDSLATAGQQKNHSLLNHLTCLVVTSRCSGLDNYFAKSTHLSGPLCLFLCIFPGKTKQNRVENKFSCIRDLFVADRTRLFWLVSFPPRRPNLRFSQPKWNLTLNQRSLNIQQFQHEMNYFIIGFIII